ncbi:hypothetical protein [Pseudoduganella albidiflava]|uniref:Uncharacterized protein n=1 Tax=Pseudoduganella albidiflava TaxID=321983 RepID=A0ABX5RRQ9_9BURK|nr:hypothetical protein [Pseudoduganella albidiflava]QBI00611.1 hypothetical protein EYF70_06865 [Pseudoduganella albidiflava]
MVAGDGRFMGEACAMPHYHEKFLIVTSSNLGNSFRHDGEANGRPVWKSTPPYIADTRMTTVAALLCASNRKRTVSVVQVRLPAHLIGHV